MGHLVKVKVVIASASTAVLLLTTLLSTNFFSTPTIKKWSTLSWDDFQGIPRPFSSFAAAISSRVYLEYDSSRERYMAYAGQNNIGSWTTLDDPGALVHEQYHFNITELHARKLNSYIDENPDGSLNLFQLRLNSINLDLVSMQNRYDFETEHSLRFDQQTLWQYRIDSMLNIENGWMTDRNGMKVFFPRTPFITPDKKDSTIFFKYELKDYGVYFFGMAVPATRMTNEQFRTWLGYDLETIKFIAFDSTGRRTKCHTFLKDSVNSSSQIWINDHGFVRGVSATYHHNYADTVGFYKIAASFVNAFNIANE